MICTSNVRMYYQPHCPECMKQVEETVSLAIRDASVAGVSMVAQKRCEHDALAAPRLMGSGRKTEKPATQPPPAAALVPGMSLLPGVEDSLNGFDSGGVN